MLRIQARVGLPVTSDEIWSRIEDLSQWQSWNPVEADVSGTIAFGGKLSFVEHIGGLPPRVTRAGVVDWQPQAQLVLAERRGFLFQSVRYFEIEKLGQQNCIFANGFLFGGLRGEMFHDRHRAALRQATEAVCLGLKGSLGL
jgi:Polyketide cyclase / dehydrase and lipid transport.